MITLFQFKILLSVLLILLVRPANAAESLAVGGGDVKGPAAANCIEECANSSNKPTKHCECCFEKLPRWGSEVITTGEWWTKVMFQKRSPWILTRNPNEPIPGEETVIASTLYTHSKNTLKLTAIFPPLFPSESRTATLRVTGVEKGKARIASCGIVENMWNCLFRINDLPTMTGPYEYIISYTPDPKTDPNLVYTYDGLIPVPKDYPKVAALGCFGAGTCSKLWHDHFCSAG